MAARPGGAGHRARRRQNWRCNRGRRWRPPRTVDGTLQAIQDDGLADRHVHGARVGRRALRLGLPSYPLGLLLLHRYTRLMAWPADPRRGRARQTPTAARDEMPTRLGRVTRRVIEAGSPVFLATKGISFSITFIVLYNRNHELVGVWGGTGRRRRQSGGCHHRAHSEIPSETAPGGIPVIDHLRSGPDHRADPTAVQTRITVQTRRPCRPGSPCRPDGRADPDHRADRITVQTGSPCRPQRAAVRGASKTCRLPRWGAASLTRRALVAPPRFGSWQLRAASRAGLVPEPAIMTFHGAGESAPMAFDAAGREAA
jgi:hypothetical protein